MPEFTDTNGKIWTVRLDAPTIADVRRDCEVDLADMEGKVASDLENDPVLLVNVLYVVCREQAIKGDISDRDFGRSIVGDPIGAATKALTDAITDFFPSGKRTLLRSLVNKQGEIRDKGTALALAKLNNPELEAKLVAAMEGKMDAEILKLIQSVSATSGPELSE